MKDPFVESLLEKKSTCLNNPEKSSATKIQEHIPSGYLLWVSYLSFRFKDIYFKSFI